MNSMLIKSMVTALVVLLFPEPLLAIPKNPGLEGCLFAYSEQGICSICSSLNGTELTITNCGDKTIIRGCYQDASFSACTNEAPEESRRLAGCTDSDYRESICFHSLRSGSTHYFTSIASQHAFFCPTFKHLYCNHLSPDLCIPAAKTADGTCQNKQQKCSFSLNEYNDFEEVRCTAPECQTVYGSGSILYLYGNESHRSPVSGCPELLPGSLHLGELPDENSVIAAKNSLLFFLAVNRYRTGDSTEEQELPLTDSPLECKGIRIHNDYLLTSDHCGHSLQNWLTGSGNGTEALIKVFGAGHLEGVGYITPGSVFHFSNTQDEFGTGDAALISINTLAEGSLVPQYGDQSINLGYNLFLITSDFANTKTLSCLIGLDSSKPDLYQVTYMESYLEPWEGEPVFWQKSSQTHFEFELVGWVDISRANCGNSFNFNEDCVRPVTGDIKHWIKKTLSQTPSQDVLPEIPADGCFGVTTAAKVTTDGLPAEPKHHYVREISIPIATFITGVTVGAIAVMLPCVYYIKIKKRTWNELNLLPAD